MQHLANNLPDSFTDLKGVTKSLNPARNAPERVEVPIKTTQLPIPKKRGSSTASDLEHASRKQQRKARRKTSEAVNAGQLNVEKHLMGSIHPVEGQLPQPSSSMHKLTGTSEHPDSIVLGNHEESLGVQEISINYVDSGESFDRKTTTVDIYFAKRLQIPFSLIMIQGLSLSAKSAPTGLNGRMQSKQKLPRLTKERYSLKQYRHLPVFSLWDSNGFFSGNGMRTMRW